MYRNNENTEEPVVCVKRSCREKVNKGKVKQRERSKIEKKKKKEENKNWERPISDSYYFPLLGKEKYIRERKKKGIILFSEV